MDVNRIGSSQHNVSPSQWLIRVTVAWKIPENVLTSYSYNQGFNLSRLLTTICCAAALGSSFVGSI